MRTSSRRIYKLPTTNPSELKQLLETLFIEELIFPSKRFWFVSPWISDIVILDNRAGSYKGVCPSWPNREIRISDIICRFLEMGTICIVATRPDPHNQSLVNNLERISRDGGTIANLHIEQRANLHVKGLLGDSFLLSGSMNLTYNGIEILEEMVELETDQSKVAEAQIAFLDNYGGR